MMNANPEGERVRGKLDSIQTFLGEKRTLPIKEYEIKYSQHREQEVLSRSKASQGSLGCISLKALLVFKPEAGVINLHLEPPSRAKAAVVKRSDKGHGASAHHVSRSYAAKEAKESKQSRYESYGGKANTKIMYPSPICPWCLCVPFCLQVWLISMAQKTKFESHCCPLRQTLRAPCIARPQKCRDYLQGGQHQFSSRCPPLMDRTIHKGVIVGRGQFFLSENPKSCRTWCICFLGHWNFSDCYVPWKVPL